MIIQYFSEICNMQVDLWCNRFNENRLEISLDKQ